MCRRAKATQRSARTEVGRCECSENSTALKRSASVERSIERCQTPPVLAAGSCGSTEQCWSRDIDDHSRGDIHDDTGAVTTAVTVVATSAAHYEGGLLRRSSPHGSEKNCWGSRERTDTNSVGSSSSSSRENEAGGSSVDVAVRVDRCSNGTNGGLDCSEAAVNTLCSTNGAGRQHYCPDTISPLLRAAALSSF